MADAELVGKVATELERLLSKKNLSEDKQIASALNPQLYVPVATLLSVQSVKDLTTDADVVVAAAKKSEALGLDDSQRMVRPLLKSKRDTVILRDVPDDANDEEVRGLIAGHASKPTVVEVTKEVNQIWFVKFETEEVCQDVAWWLRSQKFRGEPVKVAIKSEHFLRSFFQAPAGSALPTGKGDGGPAMMPGMPYGGKNPGMHGFWMPYMGGVDGPVVGAPMPIVADQANLPANILDNVGRGRGGSGYGKGGSMEKGKGTKGTKGKGKGKRRSDVEEPDAGLIRAMGDMNFGAPDAGTGPVGYEHEFRKYTSEEMKSIVATMTDVKMPDVFLDAEHKDVVCTAVEGWAVAPPEDKTPGAKDESKEARSPKAAGTSPKTSPKSKGGKAGYKWVEAEKKEPK